MLWKPNRLDIMTRLWRMFIREWKVKLVRSVNKKPSIFKESYRQEEVMNLRPNIIGALSVKMFLEQDDFFNLYIYNRNLLFFNFLI